jgi:hypothetical protein
VGSPSRQAFLTNVSGLFVAERAQLGSEIRLVRRSGRDVARIETASSPAFVAPGLPIAIVPTGTPPGIWTIDRSESSP